MSRTTTMKGMTMAKGSHKGQGKGWRKGRHEGQGKQVTTQVTNGSIRKGNR